jgi:hypothetical protein
MLHCQNCGQTNTQSSNFCRFCGVKIAAQQFAPAMNFTAAQQYAPVEVSAAGGNNFEYAPPRPYSWKTDEYQIPPPKTAPKNQPRKTIAQVQPLADFRTRPDLNLQQYQPQAVAVSHGYHCPRCSSMSLPKASKKISTAGWIVFAALLVTFFPLFWIGFLIKEETRACPVCNFKFE